MSAKPMSKSVPVIERNIALAFDFTEALVEDPSLLADVPNGATLVLIPDDEPAIAEANLRGAIEAFRSGRNVYLRHVSSAPR